MSTSKAKYVKNEKIAKSMPKLQAITSSEMPCDTNEHSDENVETPDVKIAKHFPDLKEAGSSPSNNTIKLPPLKSITVNNLC